MRRSRRSVLTAGFAAAAGIAAAEERASGGPAFPIQGIDVSRWQREIDFARVAASEITFGFCKATEGLAHVDPRFATNWPAMLDAGLIRGAYHFGRPGVDAARQADFVFDTVQPAAGDLPIVLDLEQDDGRSPPDVRGWTEAFVARLRERMGVPPIVYTGLFFWRDKAGDGDSLGCPLWLAAYVDDPATYVPRAWRQWAFWQYTSKGTVPGIRGHVDRDAWHGDRKSLDALRLPSSPNTEQYPTSHMDGGRARGRRLATCGEPTPTPLLGQVGNLQ